MKKIHALFIPLFVHLSSCDNPVTDDLASTLVTTIDDIRNKGKLIVLTRHDPTTYFFEHDEAKGFEYDLTQQLAKSLNIDVEYKVYNNSTEIMAALAAGEGHIAAAGLTTSDAGSQHFNLGPSYKSIEQKVVCNKRVHLPKTNRDLSQHSLLVITDSGSENTLSQLKLDFPSLKWDSRSELTSEQILAQVNTGEIDCTIAASNVMNIHKPFYPNILEAYTLAEEKLAWVLPEKSDHLRAYIENWFTDIKSDSTLKDINERYYGYNEIFDYYDTYVFLERIKKRLPKYLDSFKQVASTYNIPWTLLATQAYQESHWDPQAESPTGVRGLMMLTKNTAKALGIADRLNPKQSIKGGARYLQKLLNKIPKEVAEKDRIWFALAAYNIGYAHLLDARALARKKGLNPNLWADIKQMFPLLSDKKHYKSLKYGYARGKEPVQYIDRIRLYHDVLMRSVTSKQA